MTDKDNEKVIDYEPSSSKKDGCKKCWVMNSTFLILTWIAISGMWVYFEDRFKKSGDTQALISRINSVESELKEMGINIFRTPAKISGLPSELPDSDNVINNADVVKHGDLDVVEERIRTIEDRLREVKSLESEIKETKDLAASAKQGTSGPLIMALVQVQQQIQKGQPFDKELELIVVEAKSDPTIMQNIGILKSYADGGVKTIEELRDQFRKLAGAVVSASRKSEEKGVWGRTKNQLLNMISIRDISNDFGNSTEAIIVRAEKALNNYNIADAVAELDNLEEKSRLVIADWLEKAGARVAVEYAIDGIYNRITRNSVENKG